LRIRKEGTPEFFSLSPFDSVRFGALLKGLDVTIVSKSSMVAQSEKSRMDAKYYCKASVRARHLIGQNPTVRLGVVTSVLRKGIFDIKADTYVENGAGIPFVRISDLKDGIINEESTACISEASHRKEAATTLERGDLAISKTAYPAAALITFSECNVSQDIIATKLSASGRRRFFPEYVVLFLCSPIGLDLMGAEFQGNVQEHLGLTDARRLPIPDLSRGFQSRVKKTFQRAIVLRGQSVATLNEAQMYLAANLGLANWSPAEPQSYVSLSTTARASERLDSEFYAPRIRDLIARLGKKGAKLGDVAPARHEKFDAAAPGTFAYIEISDLEGDGTASSVKLDCADAPSRATWHVRSGDVITSMVRPIRRLSALIEEKQAGFVCSSGFVVLQPRAVRPEVLLTYLRLPLFLRAHGSAHERQYVSGNFREGLTWLAVRATGRLNGECDL
jgi:type I restriction enzyme, S subunit